MRIGIAALGNILMRDDGVGQHLLHHLEAHWELPAGVEALDLGTPGPELADYFAPFSALIVLDAVRAAAPAGQVRLYRRDQLGQIPKGPRMSPHDPGLVEALLKAEFTGEAPADVLLVGVVPQAISPGTELSPAVEAALPQAAAEVVAELSRLGVRAQRRLRPRDDRPFWARSGSNGAF